MAMRFALACVAMAMIPAAARAEPQGKSPGCPGGGKLVELVRGAFPDMPIKPSDLVCRVLRARAPTWLITFAASGCGDPGAGAAAIVQSGAVTWSDPGFGAPGTPCRGGTWQAADLDGDGSDELLLFEDYQGHEGFARRSLGVMAIESGKPVPGDGLALASRGSRLDGGRYTWECSAGYRLVPAQHGARRIQLVGHGHVPDADCPKDGRHVYAWQRGKLIEP